MNRTCKIRAVTAVCMVVATCVLAENIQAAPTYITSNLTNNRYNALPKNRLQVVIAYDGNGTGVTVGIEYENTAYIRGWLMIGGGNPGGLIYDYGTKFNTFEYDFTGYKPTGRLLISGAVPNGVVDGVAVGLHHKDALGKYIVLRSASDVYSNTSDFIGLWPMGFGEAAMISKMPQINGQGGGYTLYCAQLQAIITIGGAKLLPNGLGFAM